MTDPWENEPDRLDFDADGLPCTIVRLPMLRCLCGYVGVHRGHPWFGLSTDAIVKLPPSWFAGRRIFDQGTGALDLALHLMHGRGNPAEDGCAIGLALHVHRGVNYADAGFPDGTGRDLWVFGFDCGHAGDYLPGKTFEHLVPKEVIDTLPDDVREMAERILAQPEESQYRDIGYVTAECQSLARQLVRIAEIHETIAGPKE